MSFATRHNKGIIFDCATEGFEYKKLEDLYKEDPTAIYKIQGLYINTKGDYDPAPVLIGEEFFINLPAHLYEVCKGILASDEDVADIKAGKVGVSIYEYEKEVNKKIKTCYSINWVDVE